MEWRGWVGGGRSSVCGEGVGGGLVLEEGHRKHSAETDQTPFIRSPLLSPSLSLKTASCSLD